MQAVPAILISLPIRERPCGSEIEADVILLAKAIDGVYDSDPKLNPNAKKYDEIPIAEVVDKRLAVMDLTASIMCMENKMSMLVFGLEGENSIVDTVKENLTERRLPYKKKSEDLKMDERLKGYDEKMTKSYDAMLREFTAIRAGRANPHVLDKLKVDYYGTPTPIQQVGNISVPEPRMLQIQPWEKSLIKAIEKAIMTSDLGITPSNDGTVIRLVFPELTEERRKELVKDIKKKGRLPR